MDTGRCIIIPCDLRLIKEVAIYHMMDCGWISKTNRGKQSICVIYDSIHCNAPRTIGDVEQTNIAQSANNTTQATTTQVK
jgi:hypothetical protein